MTEDEYQLVLRGDGPGATFIVALTYEADDKDLITGMVELKLVGPFNNRGVAVAWAQAAARVQTELLKEVHYYLTQPFDAVLPEALR